MEGATLMILDDLIKLPILQKPGAAAAQEADAGFTHEY